MARTQLRAPEYDAFHPAGHRDPKRKRGNELRTSLTRRASILGRAREIALAGLVALLAGCASSSDPLGGRVTRQSDQNLGQVPVTASVTESGYAQNYQPGPQPTYASAPPQNGYSQQPYSQAGNGYPQPSPYAQNGYPAPSNGWTPAPGVYGPPTSVTTRYVDPNVMPVGATGVAPMGPQAGPPMSAFNSPPGPPAGSPGNVEAGPSTSMTIGPVSTKKSDDDDEWDWSHLAPEYTWKEFKQAVGFGPDHKLAKEAYDRGLALYKDKNYEDAAKEFYTASWRWPDSSMEEDAMFLEGESYYFSDHYGSAQDSYTNLLKAHDNTRYMDTVIARLFMIGTYWEQLDLQNHHWPMTPNPFDKAQPLFDTFGNAMACYEAVWLHYPTGPLADAALMRVGNAHFRREEWEEAADKYDILRKNHPKSKYQKDAHLLELQAKMKIYQGPKYSIVPLNDAQELADQTLKQFPGQLGDEERRVRETRAGIFEQRAEREWVMAQYYDHKAEYRAAREYYKVLLDKYSHTTFGEKAAARVQEIRNEPDEPPDYFKWLKAPFGDGK
jgi:outer membrane protein assembly factor BamD (BamD/ComL family)